MIIAKNEGSDFQRPKEGTQQAVCYAVADIGRQETPWGIQHKAIFLWELAETMKGGEYDGKRFVVSKKYTVSIHPKSNLGQDIKAWTGKEFADKEQFDLEKLKGKNCLLVIQYKKNEQTGKEYTNIVGISPLMDGMKPMKPENKDLPDWVKKLQQNQAKTPEQKESDEFAKDTSFDESWEKIEKEAENDPEAQSDDVSF
jgi:hypothetical protein